MDVLVCNAASNPYYGPMAGIADEQFRKILDNNIVANHWLINFVAPRHDRAQARLDHHRLVDRRAARLARCIGAYCISKAADLQLARNLAVEYGPHNVRVNCIAPGLIRTDFARALWDNPDALAARNAETPLRRIGEPDEIAGAAVFLASQAGSLRHRTGHRRRRRRHHLRPARCIHETQNLEAFRAETRAWLEANCPAEMRQPMAGEDDVCWGGRNASVPVGRAARCGCSAWARRAGPCRPGRASTAAAA